MHVDDMRKLARLWKKKGLPGFFLQNKWTDPNVPWPHWRIRKKGTTSMDEKGLKIRMHWGIPIDIFMILNAPKSIFLRRKMVKIYKSAEELSTYCYLKNKNKFSNMISNFRCKFLYRILFFLSDISKNSGELYYPGNFKNNFFKRDVFFPVKRINFEKIETNGHNNEHEYLTKIFGDYMCLPPEEKRHGHLSFIVDLNKDFSEYVTYDCSRYV